MGFAMRSKTTIKQPTVIGVDIDGAHAVVGIDLGTCNSRVAIWQDGDALIIPNEKGRYYTPSCVAFTDDAVLFGDAARERADVDLANTIFAPQRLISTSMGNPWIKSYAKQFPSHVEKSKDGRPRIKVNNCGVITSMLPEEILTLLLVHLRKCAESFLGVLVMDVVVTVPSKFGSYQRQAIAAACSEARLNVLSLVTSPTASALAYSMSNHSVSHNGHILICNAGGTYFDFALIRIDNGHIIERGVGTDVVDLDGCLVDFCMRDFTGKYSAEFVRNPGSLWRMREACEQAKIKLSQYGQARIEVKNIIDGIDYVCHISRGHFEELCRDDLRRLFDPVSYILGELGIDKGDVEQVVLVGGLSCVPLLSKLVKEFFHGKIPRVVLRPDHAAVLGAAVYASMVAAAATGTCDVAPELSHLRVTQMHEDPGGQIHSARCIKSDHGGGTTSLSTVGNTADDGGGSII